jgi:two-component system alkaline phosphatase synthesis response regulator PhoP
MSNNQSHKILVVDDDPDILEMLQYNLEREGYTVKTAADGQQALAIVKDFLPDLVLMDIMMPYIDGMEAGRRMRETPELNNTLIIFLTARVEEYAEVAAFNIGADDYITKPIKPRALTSRISALFRRELNKNKEFEKLIIKDLVMDQKSYTVFNKGLSVALPKKEFDLLLFLAQHPNQVFDRDALLNNIWGTNVFVLVRTVDVHIRKIREKIGEGYITTIKGVGYKFEANDW